jgi:Cu+-exporting ATPase
MVTPLIQGDSLKKGDAVDDTALLHLIFQGEIESITYTLKSLDGMEGVLGHVVNQKKATIKYKPTICGARDLLKVLNAEKKRPDLEIAVDPAGSVKTVGEVDPTLRQDLLRCVPLLAGVMFLLMMAPKIPALVPFLNKPLVPGLHMQTAGLLLLCYPIMFVFGARFHKGAYKSFKTGVLDMNVLISVSTGLTFGYSVLVCSFSVIASVFMDFPHANPPPSYFEAPAMIITFILVGKYLEGSAKQATADCLNELLRSQPLTANLLEDAQKTRATSVPVELVQMGDAVQVFPGEAVPVDGIMSTESEATFDESLLTGESKPIRKYKGDKILGGSRSVTGRAVMQVTRIGSGTMLSQISSLVESAQTTRAPVQTVADSIAKYFIPFVLVLATMTWFVWYTLVFVVDAIPMEEIAPDGTTWPFLQKYFFVMEFGLTVLLVACPCALGLATPTAVMTATGVAAKHGILLKSGGLPLELGSKLTHLILDKTGTITMGKPIPYRCALLDRRGPVAAKSWELLKEAYLQNIKNQRPRTAAKSHLQFEFLGESLDPVHKAAFWWAVGCAEISSEHPLGKELVEVAQAECGAELSEPGDFTNVTGKGVRCTLGGALSTVNVTVGSMPSILQESSLEQASGVLEPWTKQCRAQAGTVIGVSVNNVPLGGIALRDQVAPYAKECIHDLQEKGVEIWMCTGDHAATAQAVAKECGIPPWKISAGALPTDKVNQVRKLQQEVNYKTMNKKNIVAMVGDGINDSPALAVADVGIAIGAGHNVTVDAADVVLVRSDFRNLLTYMQLSKETIRKIWKNFFWAFIFNVCALPIAAGMFYSHGMKMTPVMATAIMATSSLFVVNNSLSLRHFEPQIPEF